jgi:uncharacterized protein (TIRG00374 family)
MTRSDSQSALRSKFWGVVKIGLAVALAGFVLRKSSVAELAALWQRTSLPWLLAAILFFWATLWSNARCYWVVLDKKVAFPQVLSLVLLQTIFGNLIATSAGAASFVGVLRSKHDIPLSRGISALLLSRFGDIIALMLALGLSSAFVWFQVSSLQLLVVLLLSAMIGLIGIFVVVLILRQRLVRLLDRLIVLLRLNRLGLVERFVHGLSDLAEQDTGYVQRLICPMLVYSLASMTFSLAFAYAIVHVFAIPIGLWQVVFMSSLLQFMTLIPIQVFGGLGVLDVANLYLYGLFGISQAVVTSAIIGSRILFYLMNLLLLFYFPLESRLVAIQKMDSLAALEGQTHSSTRQG